MSGFLVCRGSDTVASFIYFSWISLNQEKTLTIGRLWLGKTILCFFFLERILCFVHHKKKERRIKECVFFMLSYHAYQLFSPDGPKKKGVKKCVISCFILAHAQKNRRQRICFMPINCLGRRLKNKCVWIINYLR